MQATTQPSHHSTISPAVKRKIFLPHLISSPKQYRGESRAQEILSGEGILCENGEDVEFKVAR